MFIVKYYLYKEEPELYHKKLIAVISGQWDYSDVYFLSDSLLHFLKFLQWTCITFLVRLKWIPMLNKIWSWSKEKSLEKLESRI